MGKVDLESIPYTEFRTEADMYCQDPFPDPARPNRYSALKLVYRFILMHLKWIGCIKC